LGVDGAPETYVVDEHGMIRYRHSGYPSCRTVYSGFPDAETSGRAADYDRRFETDCFDSGD
jgi:hypothetical protein